jgi:hypothetical protein
VGLTKLRIFLNMREVLSERLPVVNRKRRTVSRNSEGQLAAPEISAPVVLLLQNSLQTDGLLLRVQFSKFVKAKWHLLSLCVLLLGTSLRASTFTFKSGTKFEGEVVEFKGTNMVIVRNAKDANLYTITASMLAGNGQQRLDELRTEQAKVLAEQHRLAARRSQEDDVPAEQEEKDPSAITGNFGLKLGQRFNLSLATSTNSMITPYGFKIPSYGFQPSYPLTNFTSYWVDVTPRSNVIYSISASTSADFDSSYDWELRMKLLAALEEKYGKSVQSHTDEYNYNRITKGTRTVSLIYSRRGGPGVIIDYQDGVLAGQAEREQKKIEAASPERKDLKEHL